jgi:hypothetical protein
MGKPNFQRLAELGQLPDYISPTVDQALAQVDAMRKEKKETVIEKKIEESEKKVAEIVVEKPKRSQSKKEEFIDNLI